MEQFIISHETIGFDPSYLVEEKANSSEWSVKEDDALVFNNRKDAENMASYFRRSILGDLKIHEVMKMGDKIILVI